MANRFFSKEEKGNKGTLLDTNGTPLPDQSLTPFLGPVDEAFFRTMFGMDSESLREGAEELLRGEGNLGSALFSAALVELR